MSRKQVLIEFTAALVVLSFSRVGWTIGTTQPNWKPFETVTDTLASQINHAGSDRTLAYDHHGNPGIAFYDDVNEVLRYARRVPGVGWVHSEVDGTGDVGKYPSLAYDRYERPAISYFDETNDNLKYAHFNGTAWQVETMADSADRVGQYTSLEFDLLGRPAVAYRDITNTSLKYISDTDGDLSLADETPITIVNDFNEGLYASLVFDPLNRPMITHHASSPDFDLRFSVLESGLGWVTTTVDSTGDTGRHPSIAIDPDSGYPAIAYQLNGADDLRYAAWDGDSWDLTTVDSSGDVGSSPSLAFDPADGNPAIAYLRSTNWDLKLSPSLAFNDFGTGFPSIAYFNSQGSGSGHLYFIEDPPALPEPGSLTLLSIGVAAALIRRREICA